MLSPLFASVKLEAAAEALAFVRAAEEPGAIVEAGRSRIFAGGTLAVAGEKERAVGGSNSRIYGVASREMPVTRGSGPSLALPQHLERLGHAPLACLVSLGLVDPAGVLLAAGVGQPVEGGACL